MIAMADSESGGTPDRQVDQYHTGRDSWFTEGTERPAEPERAGPERTIHEPARETPVYEETDVLVVGGGPAGCAAAVAARRLGRQGHARRALQPPRRPLHRRPRHLDRPDERLGGAPDHHRLRLGDPRAPARRRGRRRAPGAVGLARGRARRPLARAPERLPRRRHVVADDRPRVAEVRVGRAARGGRRAADPARLGGRRRSSRATSCAARSSRARRAAARSWPRSSSTPPATSTSAPRPAPPTSPTSRARAPTSSTASTRRGRGPGIDFAQWVAWKREHPEAHRALFKRGHEELGYLETPHAGWRDDVGLFMGPRLTGYSGLKVADLTAVEIESRRRMTAHLEFFRRNAPGFEDAWLMLSAPAARRAPHAPPGRARTRWSMEEWREAVRHDDEIGVSPSPSAKFANISVPYGVHRPRGARQRPRRRSPRRHRPADAGLHARDPAVLAHRPGGRRRGRAVGRAAARRRARSTCAELQHELRGQGVYLQTAGARAAA